MIERDNAIMKCCQLISSKGDPETKDDQIIQDIEELKEKANGYVHTISGILAI